VPPAVVSTTICVCNLPDYLTDREFRFIFKFAWGFERASINRTKTGHQVGYARFSSVVEAQQALDYLQGFPLDEDYPSPVKCFMSSTQLNDELLDKPGKRTFGEMAGQAEAGLYPQRPFLRKANPLSVYVGGIPHDWEDAQLTELFSPFGAITSLQLHEGKSQELGKIAFIFYSDATEATAAIQNLNHYPLDETRHLVVRQNTSNPLRRGTDGTGQELQQ
jgi:hypothetical protein